MPLCEQRFIAGWLKPPLLLLLAAMSVGCTAVIVPPDNVRDPTAVLLLDHGRHVSLVLPDDDGVVRYAYGDWDWYAQRRTGAGEAVRALLAPSAAALGRRHLDATPAPDAVRAQLRVGVREVYTLVVEQARARALVRELDAVFRAHREFRHYNRAYDLFFVRHPQPYRMTHNSNHVTADWLRQLGCEVRGPVMVADWQVRGGSDAANQ